METDADKPLDSADNSHGMIRVPSTSLLTAVYVLLVGGAFVLWIFPGDAGEQAVSSHLNARCSSCHSVIAQVGSDVTEVPSYDVQCRICHSNLDQIDKKHSFQFHSNAGRGCRECHSFHEPKAITAAGRQFTLQFESSSRLGQCLACHRPGENTSALSEGHRAAALLYHSNHKPLNGMGVSQSCLLCHNKQRSGDIEAYASTSLAPQFTEHAAHPVGVLLVPGSRKGDSRIRSTIDSRLQLIEGRVECTTCHSLTASTKFHLIPFDNGSDLCRGCHFLD